MSIGALSIGTSIYVTNSKLFGIIFPIRTLFIALLIYGIGMIVYGATGKLSLDEMLKNKIHSLDELHVCNILIKERGGCSSTF